MFVGDMIFKSNQEAASPATRLSTAEEPTGSAEEPAGKTKKEDVGEEEAVDSEEGATLFVKNISFETTDEALREVKGLFVFAQLTLSILAEGRPSNYF